LVVGVEVGLTLLDDDIRSVEVVSEITKSANDENDVYVYMLRTQNVGKIGFK